MRPSSAGNAHTDHTSSAAVITRCCCPVAASQIRTMSSAPAEASITRPPAVNGHICHAPPEAVPPSSA